MTQEGANTRLTLGDGQSVLLQNIAPTGIGEQNFGFFSDSQTLESYAKYMSNSSIYWGTAGIDNGLLPSNLGDMRYFGLGGADVLGGVTSNDLIDGGDGTAGYVGKRENRCSAGGTPSERVSLLPGTMRCLG